MELASLTSTSGQIAYFNYLFCRLHAVLDLFGGESLYAFKGSTYPKRKCSKVLSCTIRA